MVGLFQGWRGELALILGCAADISPARNFPTVTKKNLAGIIVGWLMLLGIPLFVSLRGDERGRQLELACVTAASPRKKSEKRRLCLTVDNRVQQ